MGIQICFTGLLELKRPTLKLAISSSGNPYKRMQNPMWAFNPSTVRGRGKEGREGWIFVSLKLVWSTQRNPTSKRKDNTNRDEKRARANQRGYKVLIKTLLFVFNLGNKRIQTLLPI